MVRVRKDNSGERRHVAIVGFAGSGKTTIGQTIAKRLGATFIDLDAVISKSANRSITEIFREHGEVGFRAYERAALREVLEKNTPTVIATGGSTFVDASMRGWVQAVARTIYLKASPEVILTRIGAGSGSGRMIRPILSGSNPLATIKRLLNECYLAYEQSDIVINTDNAGCEEVAAEILAALERRERLPKHDNRFEAKVMVSKRGDSQQGKIKEAKMLENKDESIDEIVAVSGQNPDGTALLRVHTTTGSYPVELRHDAGLWIAQAIAVVAEGTRIAIISDDTVAKLHSQALRDSLAAQNKQVTLHTFLPGETSKTLDTAGLLYDELLTAGLTRSDAVVALGGGVVGDVAGFVASTFLRGIAVIQVPTTTLAAVDSSVGGKTAVNTPRGKNLVGTFYPPRAVLVAATHLATQQLRQHVAGIVEAVKMAATLDREVFQALTNEAPALLAFEPKSLARNIARAITLKAGVVTRDEHEHGERAVLNYGHTIGHAIEVGESYRFLHGEAVALGMIAEAEWAEDTGIASDVVAPLTKVLKSLGAPTDWRQATIDLAAMGLDKKRQGSTVKLPIVTTIGSYKFSSVQLDDLVSFIKSRSG
ncbi:MAG: 3-dehydroquinate synthase [Deltaproteobacteria bacterium]|nr:3-dehydroquinate synthase [Deltaproteobacteria bacterium]